jgi:hypothetical protein
MKRGGAVIALALLACSVRPPATIDGSSADSFARTAAAARDDLPVADRLDFDRAIATVPARRYANRDPSATARRAFDGMTAADIVATERERTR